MDTGSDSNINVSTHLTPWDILGIEQTNNIGDIKCAYRRMVLAIHPDRSVGSILKWSDTERQEAFSTLRDAYKTVLQKYNKCPDEDIEYDTKFLDTEYKSKKLDSFNTDSFNKEFERRRRNQEITAQEKGYKMFNAIALNRDIGTAMTELEEKIEIPTYEEIKHESQSLVETFSVSLPETIPKNSQYWDMTEISSYSINSAGKNTFSGYDLEEVHGQNSEPWELTISRDNKLFDKFNTNRKVVDMMESMSNERVSDMKVNTFSSKRGGIINKMKFLHL